MQSLPTQKKLFFYLILLLIPLSFFEGAAWGVLRFTRIGQIYFLQAKDAIRSAGSYRWYPDLKLFLPIPNSEIVLFKEEYTDRFPTKGLDGIEGGFFDNGLSNRKLRALALGDSFTRGVGSINQLQNGWVSLVEQAIPWLDVVNLGNSGTGTLQQYAFYKRIAPRIAHQIVLINFYTGNDFLDNAEPFDLNEALVKVESADEATRTGVGIQTALTLSENSGRAAAYKCDVIGSATKLICFLYHRFTAKRDVESARFLSVYRDMQDSASHPLVPKQIVELARLNRTNSSLLADGNVGSNVYIAPYQKNKNEAEILAKHSAKVVAVLVELAKQGGATPVVIIHPSVSEVYLPDGDLLTTIRRPTAILKELVSEAVPVYDLTQQLRERAATSPRLYYRIDDHYTPAGYRMVSELVTQFLTKHFSQNQ